MTATLSEQRALRLRPVTDEDDAFLSRLVHDLSGGGLAAEVSGEGPDELDLQRRAQDDHHKAAHPTAHPVNCA